MQNPPPSPSGQKSGLGIEPNLAAALSYFWIVGLIFFLIEKENRFIRFHALQSVLYGACWFALIIVLVIVNIIVMIVAGVAAGAAGDAGAVVGFLIWIIAMLIWLVVPLAYVGTLILAAVKAYQGKTFKLPIIGNMAEKIVNK